MTDIRIPKIYTLLLEFSKLGVAVLGPPPKTPPAVFCCTVLGTIWENRVTEHSKLEDVYSRRLDGSSRLGVKGTPSLPQALPSSAEASCISLLCGSACPQPKEIIDVM